MAARVGAGHRAIGALAAAFAGLAVYDLWGKRLRFPPFTDLIQGVGWAGLLFFGAAIQGPWTALTWFLAAFVVVFILMANGVHGSLRDLANDHRCGVRSTAILLGARPGHGSTAVVVPPRLARYAVALHADKPQRLVMPVCTSVVASKCSGVGSVIHGRAD